MSVFPPSLSLNLTAVLSSRSKSFHTVALASVHTKPSRLERATIFTFHLPTNEDPVGKSALNSSNQNSTSIHDSLLSLLIHAWFQKGQECASPHPHRPASERERGHFEKSPTRHPHLSRSPPAHDRSSHRSAPQRTAHSPPISYSTCRP